MLGGVHHDRLSWSRCLVATDVGQTRSVNAKIVGVVIDCPDPAVLAPFYEALLGVERSEDSPDWVTLAVDGGPTVSLQRTEHFVAPNWATGDPPQQLHLDLLVDNLDEGQSLVLRLGGRLLDGSDKPIGYRVFADLVGHPFCLVTPEGLT